MNTNFTEQVSGFLASFFPYQWPPDLPLSGIYLNSNFTIAYQYFFYNILIILVATLWGGGVLSGFLRYCHAHKRTINFPSFLFLSAGLGFSLIITEIFVLVLCQSLIFKTVWMLAILNTIGSCILVFQNRLLFKPNIEPMAVNQWPGFLIILLAMAFYQFNAASVGQLSDSTAYHLPYADFFLQNLGITAVPDQLIYPYQTLNFNLLYSVVLMFNRELSYLQTFHAVFATLTAFGVYCFCLTSSRHFFLVVGIPLIFIAKVPAIHLNRLGANVDCGSMYFILCSVFSLYLYLQNRISWLLVVSAITFGIAIGTKYLMCIFALPIGVVLLTHENRNLKPLVTYICCAAVFGLWWYIRNWILTGNPVHPFATNLFGNYLWSQKEVTEHTQGMLIGNFEKSFRSFILMPFYAYKSEALRYAGIAFTITLFYLSTVFYWLVRKEATLLFLCSWVYLILWYLGAQESRYLMPALPLIFIYTSMVVNALYTSLFKQHVAGKLVSLFFAIPGIFIGFVYLQQDFTKISYSGVGNSPKAKELQMENDPVYDLISHANIYFTETEPVYEFFMRNGRWFYKGNLIGNQFGPTGYWRMVDQSVYDNGQPGLSPNKLQQTLKTNYAAVGFIIPNPPYLPYDQAAFDHYFELLYRNQEGSIYRMR